MNLGSVSFALVLAIVLWTFPTCREQEKFMSNLDDLTGKPVQVIEPAFAFPGAEGFGRNTTGGRGGKVIYVTNLNDAGPGSFRAAVETSGPRYVLFKISGNISLESRLDIRFGDLTIAGQTAPGDGICIRNYPVVINADNVIIRFLRFRLGDVKKVEADGIEGRFCKNIIIDHCSVSWSVDECFSFYGNENTTLQWSIISESLNNSVHSKGAHGYGGIWGGRLASFHHNLLAHHNSRNPRLGETADDKFALNDLVDLRNNVIYNWGGNSCYGGEAMNVNIVNCYYKPGPASSNRERIVSIDKNKTVSSEIYDIWGKYFISGNYIDGSSRATSDNWTYGVFNQFHSSYGTVSAAEKDSIRINKEHSTNGNVTTHTALLAYEKVLELAGASLSRDAIDSRIVDNVMKGNFLSNGSSGSKNGIIDSQQDVGGWPLLYSIEAPFDSSNDGMPDAWKLKNKLDPKLAQANGKHLSSAYDNVEVYINSLVAGIVSKQK
jgi:hypothetical protein